MATKTKKLSKDSKKYRDLDLKQSTLKSALHKNWRQYDKWRRIKYHGVAVKAPITMAEMEEQQKEINKIRKKIGRAPITLIEDFRKIIKNT